MFRRRAGRESESDSGTKPAYGTDGRAELYSLLEQASRERARWMFAAFGSMGLAAILALGLITIATTARVTPYVVEVDKWGAAVAFGPAERIESVDQRLVMGALFDFFPNLRRVTGDADLQAEMLQRAFDYVAEREPGSSARNYLGEYFSQKENHHAEIGRLFLRTVTVNAITRLPDPVGDKKKQGRSLWSVRWTERYVPRHGGVGREEAWEAFVVVKVEPPTALEKGVRNAVGVYITDLTWSRVRPGRESKT